MKLSEKYVLELVRNYLRVFIIPEIQGTMFTLNDISALAYRETFSKLIPLLRKGKTIEQVYKNFTGDNGNGHSPYQIDVRWHPGFIRSGDWKDLRKATAKCLKVLKQAKKVLKKHKKRKDYKQMVFSAYNCGAGRVKKAVRKGRSPDYYTHERNYGAEVMRLSRKLDKIPDIIVKFDLDDGQAESIEGISRKTNKDFKKAIK